MLWDLEYGSVAGSYEHNNEITGSIKDRKFLDKVSAPCSYKTCKCQ
jgi:hypothetical protein